MKLHVIREDLLINLDRVLHVEIEAVRHGAAYALRWTLQGNRTYMGALEFATKAEAQTHLRRLV